jgi:hypothetical protein
LRGQVQIFNQAITALGNPVFFPKSMNLLGVTSSLRSSLSPIRSWRGAGSPKRRR